jgi:SAM-dependent methyltransferase
LTRGLAFPGVHEPLDYGERLTRLRWRRAVAPDRVEDWPPSSSAREVLGAADTWVVVRDLRSVPVGAVPLPERGLALLAADVARQEPPVLHTLRELERAAPGPSPVAPARTAAVAFRVADFPVEGEESVERFLDRLFEPGAGKTADPGFRVVRFEDPSELERPELTRRLPGGRVRVLDVGCGAGGAIGMARARHPEWSLTGIERDRRLAALARARCDRVLEGDLVRVLPELARKGERFDAVVFADVLEHLADPFAALRRGRDVAAAGALLLVSVPNVGHLSLVRDLLCGRFDPVPAGLADAGHLRWFTRESLAAAIEESGWRVEEIEPEPGAPAPDAEAFLALAAQWPDCDRRSLTTYQWIAVGRAS